MKINLILQCNYYSDFMYNLKKYLQFASIENVEFVLNFDPIFDVKCQQISKKKLKWKVTKESMCRSFKEKIKELPNLFNIFNDS